MTGDTSAPNIAHAEANALAPAAGEACASQHAAIDQAESGTGEGTDETAAQPRAPRSSKPDPDRVRLCIATRQELPPDELIRFVLGPDTTIVPDLARRLPGRGVWVKATRAAVELAVKRGLFAKSLKTFAKVDKELPDQVEKLLAIEARQALSLANKAGLISTGFSKVEIALEKGQAVALITASDASADGAGKLARKFKAIRSAAQLEAPILQELSTAELNFAIGGSNVVHAALAGGGLGRRVILCFRRLGQFRMAHQGNAHIAAAVAASDLSADNVFAEDPVADKTVGNLEGSPDN